MNAQTKKKTDWTGVWFSFLPEFGEHPYIAYGHQPTTETPSSAVEWGELPHEHFDGIGGFIHLLGQKNIGFGDIPRLRESRPPAYLITLKKLYGIELFSTPEPYLWDVEYDEPPYKMSPPPHFSFDSQTTGLIESRALAEQVSVNSLLIYCLNRAASILLLNEPVKNKWMIPVNMRGSTGVTDDTANQASCVLCEIPSQGTAQDIHRSIKNQFAADAHWHTWRLLNIGKFIGRGALRYLYRREYRASAPWTGVFSNLGNWTLESEGAWYFTPPTTRGCPVSAGAITINGRLHLALHTHQSWRDHSRHSRKILDHWVELIFAQIKSLPGA